MPNSELMIHGKSRQIVILASFVDDKELMSGYLN
jgi:hypothetical protein